MAIRLGGALRRGVWAIALVPLAMACHSRPAAPATANDDRSPWTRHFDLDRREPAIQLSNHRATFVAGHYTDSPNEASNPSPPTDRDREPLEHGEFEFQFSVKTRLPLPWLDRGPGVPDLWIAYTQQSHWQVGMASGPFRETNYEPEGFLLWPASDFGDLGDWGPLQLKAFGIGASHHSNGRGAGDSRSWNRVIGQLAFELGDATTVLLRPWHRLAESAPNDDNPDIDDYFGDGDMTIEHSFRLLDVDLTAGLLLRNNLERDPNRGAVQAWLAGPFFHPRLNWFVQGFSGYGESLIDYDHRQQTLAIGITLRDF